jgi:hypothetical protein
MRISKTAKRTISFISAALLTILLSGGVSAMELPVSAIDIEYIISQVENYRECQSYADYLSCYSDARRPSDIYVIEASDYVASQDMELVVYNDYMGKEGKSVLTGEEGVIEYHFECRTAGLYNISVMYYPVEGKSSSIERSVLIDGSLPFAESAIVKLPRVWKNELDEFQKDNQGNDIRPKQVEAPEWREQYLYDSEGYCEDPLLYYFTEGLHTISIMSQREPVILRKITVANRKPLLSYAEMEVLYAQRGYTDAQTRNIEIQAESASRKSSPMLYPICDHSTPAISPYSPKVIKNNTIGGDNWRVAGDWIEWDFTAPEDGLYEIAFWVKQSFVRGTYSARRLFIDGEVPFQEMNEIVFTYERHYRLQTLSDENQRTYKFYMTKGTHTLRLEAVLGRIGDIIREVEDCILQLNEIYRSVLMITGILVALGAGLNIPSQIGIPINIPYVGEIMTGLLLSRGANFIHDVFGKVNEIYKRAKAKLYRG